jgi:hypothetical protein
MGCIGRAGVPAWRLCWWGLAAAACLAATIAATSAAASPSYGTFTVMPSSVYIGSTRDFSLEFAATVGFDGGMIQFTVPSGWPAPVNTAGTGSGDVSCPPAECPSLSISGNTITISFTASPALPLPVPVITVSYWAAVPAVSGGPFQALVVPNPSDQPEPFQQQVTVLPDGTFSVTPSSVYLGSTREFTLKFAASEEFSSGTVQFTIPPDWPAPVNTAGSSSGDATCFSGPCQNLSVNSDTITITVNPPAPIIPVITVSYWAAVPAVSGGTFQALVLANPSDQPEQLQQQVAVMPASVPQTTPATGTTSTIPGSPTSTTQVSLTPTTPIGTASTSTAPATGPAGSAGGASVGGSSHSAPPGSRWLWSDESFRVASGGVAGFAAVLLFAGWRLHRRPMPLTGASVHAVPRGGPPHRLTVRATGTEPTHTVRIEPHPGADKEPEP